MSVNSRCTSLLVTVCLFVGRFLLSSCSTAPSDQSHISTPTPPTPFQTSQSVQSQPPSVEPQAVTNQDIQEAQDIFNIATSLKKQGREMANIRSAQKPEDRAKCEERSLSLPKTLC